MKFQSPCALLWRAVLTALPLALLLSGAALGSAAEEQCAHCSALAPDPLQYVAPSRNFSTKHISLDLDLDVAGGRISGSVTHTLECLRDGATELRLNCVALTVDAVSLDGQPVEYDYPVADWQESSPDSIWVAGAALGDEHDGLVVHAPAPLARGQQLSLRIDYHGAPREGLYFIEREEGLSGSRPEVWSQGEGQRNRYWIPCFDYPNEKASFDGTFRVDKGMYVLSNGRLEAVTELGNKTQYRWVLEQPQVTYLIMVAAGEYEVYSDDWRGRQVLYVVPPGTGEATTRANLGRTVDMLDYFSDVIGIEYPFEKYAQVVVQNFIFGGMENTTSTVLNSRCLYDERALLDRSADDLVAHELAHQWWGDMVTLREWNQMWLNEGFATFFQKLYKQHHLGDDEYIYDFDGAHREVINNDNNDPRPMVVDFFNRRDAQSSANVYPKGAAVLDMLRQYLGDEVFFAALRDYGTRMRFQNAETQDLMRSFREVSGENTDWFFEQWVYLSGHPDLRVSKSWDNSRSTLTLKVEQTQKVTDQVPLFRLPLDIDISCAEKTESYRILVKSQSQEFHFRLPSEPLMVLFDKGGHTLMTLAFQRSIAELKYMLEHGDTWGRIEAVRALGQLGPNDEAAAALSDVLLGEGFWGLRREAALALGRNGTAKAAEALLAALETGESRVRTAAAETLGDLRLSDAVEAKLLALLDSDPSYEVRRASMRSLVKLKSGQAYEAALNALGQDSCNEVSRSNALEALAGLGQADCLERVKKLAAAGNKRGYRHEAINCYVKLVKLDKDPQKRKAAADYLVGMLDDYYVNTRSTLIGALVELGEKSAVERLRLLAQQDPVQRIRNQAKGAADKLAAYSEPGANLDEMKQQIKALQEQVEILNKAVGELKKDQPEEPVK